MRCIICEEPLSGRQNKFCSNKCQRKDWKINNREIYLAGKKEYRNKNKERLNAYNKEYRNRGLVKPIYSYKLKQIIENQGKICNRCNAPEKLQVHHIKPLQNGGLNISNNLMVLCWDCHMFWHKSLKNYWLPFNSASPLQ